MTHRVLIVEDSPTQAAELQVLLEEAGYTVAMAANGREGLASVRGERPDLVISDILMPEMDGYAFCAALKTDPLLREVPVVLVTVLSGIDDIIRAPIFKASTRRDCVLTRACEQLREDDRAQEGNRGAEEDDPPREGVTMIAELVTGAGPDQAADPGRYARATLNLPSTSSRTSTSRRARGSRPTVRWQGRSLSASGPRRR